MEFGNRGKTYKDFREVLGRDDIPIVINATPDHWHTLVNLAALKAGKDIYAEKPLTLTIDEGKRVVEAVKNSRRILQTGTQQRSDPNFRLAAEIIRNNRLGKLQEVDRHASRGYARRAVQVRTGSRWPRLGLLARPGAKVDFVPERNGFFFRYWYDYSAGTITDWGAHHNDIVQWALGMDQSGPVAIDGKPTSDVVPGGYTAYSEYKIEYTYASGVKSTVSTTTDDAGTGAPTRSGPGTRHNGIKFTGADGWLWVTRGQIKASKPEIIHDPFGSDAIRLYASTDHKANFFDCVRTRKQPICPAEIGHRSACVCHLAPFPCLARPLQWDPQKEQFINDTEADQWRSREQRKPWTYGM